MDNADNKLVGLGPKAAFKAFLREGRFMLQRSRSSGRYVFYPRMQIPMSGETDLDWVEASGKGIVYAATRNRSRKESYNIVLVDLDEGVRMMSTLPDDDLPLIGTRVTAEIREIDGEPAIVFKPEAVGAKP